MPPERRLLELGITLAQPGPKQGRFVTGVVHNGLLFLSGQGTMQANGQRITGKLGLDTTVEEGYAAARAAGTNLLWAMRDVLGSLDRVARIIKVFGMVNATENFRDHPKVIDGCSHLFVQVFGDAGEHARSAVGMSSLPNGIAVEIEAVVAVDGRSP